MGLVWILSFHSVFRLPAFCFSLFVYTSSTRICYPRCSFAVSPFLILFLCSCPCFEPRFFFFLLLFFMGLGLISLSFLFQSTVFFLFWNTIFSPGDLLLIHGCACVGSVGTSTSGWVRGKHIRTCCTAIELLLRFRTWWVGGLVTWVDGTAVQLYCYPLAYQLVRRRRKRTTRIRQGFPSEWLNEVRFSRF